MDHIIPGALGGLTTDENIRAISKLANSKKANKIITDEELQDRILSSYTKVDVPEDLYEMLLKYNVTQYKVGL